MPVRREKLGREQKKREWRGSSHLCLLSCARQEDWTLKIQTANQAKVAFVLLYPFFISQGFIGICNVSGRKNVLRKLLRILYRRLKAGFSVCWLRLFVAGVLSEMHEVRTFAHCKTFLFDMFAFFSSLENYFGFRTTNVKGKTDHSVSLKWNKGFWTFLKRLVSFWLCIRLIYELISPGWIKSRLYSVISSYGYFFYMPRFITFAEPALSLSSVKEPYCSYNVSQ